MKFHFGDSCRIFQQASLYMISYRSGSEGGIFCG